MVHGVKPGDSPPARSNEVDSSWLGGTFLQYTYPKYFLRSFPNASRASNSSAPFSTSLTHLIRSSFLCSMYFYFSHILSLYQSLFVYIIYLFVLWLIKIRWTKPVSRLCPPYFPKNFVPRLLVLYCHNYGSGDSIFTSMLNLWPNNLQIRILFPAALKLAFTQKFP